MRGAVGEDSTSFAIEITCGELSRALCFGNINTPATTSSSCSPIAPAATLSFVLHPRQIKAGTLGAKEHRHSLVRKNRKFISIQVCIVQIAMYINEHLCNVHQRALLPMILGGSVLLFAPPLISHDSFRHHVLPDALLHSYTITITLAHTHTLNRSIPSRIISRCCPRHQCSLHLPAPHHHHRRRRRHHRGRRPPTKCHRGIAQIQRSFESASHQTPTLPMTPPPPSERRASDVRSHRHRHSRQHPRRGPALRLTQSRPLLPPPP